MPIGVITWYSDAEDFGFVRSSGGRELYFHTSCVKAAVLRQNEPVSFEVEIDPDARVARATAIASCGVAMAAGSNPDAGD